MPRPRVKDEDRKRVAQACDICKRRKERCDGSQPCLLCKRRNREKHCHYSDGHRRRTSVREATTDGTRRPPPPPEADLTRSNDAEIAIESLLTLSTFSRGQSISKTPLNETSPRETSSHAPVPKLARLLRDGHGKFTFVGDSSTLAFVQNIRRIVKIAIGECSLTTDPKRHAMVEAIPSERDPGVDQQHHQPDKPAKHDARDLVKSYLLASSGIIDLFDQDDITQHVLAWTEDSRASSSAIDSIFYLILAIGAQNKPNGDEEQAAAYFRRGRDLAASSFMDDPSVLTVQSYVLIAFYMLTMCRRNGAFMLLGIAIRAAYALGLHRSDISVLFEIRERRTRDRVWKSLRVLDMFMSASLGRPPATSEVDGGNIAWEGTSRGYEGIHLQTLHSSAMLHICFIFERVLNEVYCRREVSANLVESISRQYREWDLGLSAGLRADGFVDEETSQLSELQQVTGLAHIKGSYYWSIILLTRPFLIFDVSSKLKAGTPSNVEIMNPDSTTLSAACIDAALRSIEIGSDLVHAPGCPRRLFMVTNSIFASALVIGLAMFGDYDRTFPLRSSLDQARLVLGVLARFDPSGRRFVLITAYLQEAALEYVRRRDAKQLQMKRQEIHSIFGDILHRGPANGADLQDGTAVSSDQGVSLTTLMNLHSTESGDSTLAQGSKESAGKRGPILTTSGALASDLRDRQLTEDADTAQAYATMTEMGSMLQADTDIPSASSYTEEIPFVSLMDEFDSMSDSFLDFI